MIYIITDNKFNGSNFSKKEFPEYKKEILDRGEVYIELPQLESTSDELTMEILYRDVTPEELIEANTKAITDYANYYILEAFSELKQRKLMSIALVLQDIVINSGTLNQEQESLLQSTRDANIWITSVRVKENLSIENENSLADFQSLLAT